MRSSGAPVPEVSGPKSPVQETHEPKAKSGFRWCGPDRETQDLIITRSDTDDQRATNQQCLHQDKLNVPRSSLKLSKRRLGRGVFRSVVEIRAVINRIVRERDTKPKPFT